MSANPSAQPENPPAATTCAICNAEISQAMRSLYCSRACMEEANRRRARARYVKKNRPPKPEPTPEEAEEDRRRLAAGKRGAVAREVLAPFKAAGLVADEEFEAWVGKRSAMPERVRRTKAEMEDRPRSKCTGCGRKFIPRVSPRAGRVQAFGSLVCFNETRSEELGERNREDFQEYFPHLCGNDADLREWAAGKEYAASIRSPLLPVCRGLIDFEEPCARKNRTTLRSPLGLCPSCLTETMDGRADDMEMEGRPVEEARRLIASLREAARPKHAPEARERKTRSPRRFPSVEGEPTEANFAEWVAGTRPDRRSDSGDYWAVWRERVLQECRVFMRLSLSQPEARRDRGLERALFSLYRAAHALRATAPGLRPSEEETNQLAGKRDGVLRKLAAWSPAPSGEDWMDWAIRSFKLASLEPPLLPRRTECRFCGNPVLPTVPWSDFCAAHVDDEDVQTHFLPAKEHEYRELDRARKFREESNLAAKELRRELEAREDRESEPPAPVETWAESARRLFGR